MLAFNLNGDDADEIRYMSKGSDPLEVLHAAREAIALAIESLQRVDKL